MVVSILGWSGYKFLSQTNLVVHHKLGNALKGVDVEIENFKVVHQVSGQKNWELKADLAQVNEKEKLTRLKNVELILTRKQKQELLVSADFGTLTNENKDIDLRGNVKMVGNLKLFKKQLGPQKVSSTP